MYHKVQDFEKWKAAFDAFIEVRKNAGEIDFSVGTLQNQPNTAYVINTWESIDEFEAFFGADDLKEAMGAAGVLEAPTTIILNEIGKGQLSIKFKGIDGNDSPVDYPSIPILLVYIDIICFQVKQRLRS